LAQAPTPGDAGLHQLANSLASMQEMVPDDEESIHGLGLTLAEVRLRKAEARYRALVEQIPAITFLAPLDGSLSELYVSPQIEQMLGFTAKEWLDNPILWYQQLHPDDQDRWQTEFARTLNAGEHFRSDYRFLSRDGNVVWIHREAKVVSDEDGQPLFLQGVAFDITERMRFEEKLQQNNSQLALPRAARAEQRQAEQAREASTPPWSEQQQRMEREIESLRRELREPQNELRQLRGMLETLLKQPHEASTNSPESGPEFSLPQPAPKKPQHSIPVERPEPAQAARPEAATPIEQPGPGRPPRQETPAPTGLPRPQRRWPEEPAGLPENLSRRVQPPTSKQDRWYVVYHDAQGTSQMRAGTLEGVRKLLKGQNLNEMHDILVSRTRTGPFELLGSFPELRDLLRLGNDEQPHDDAVPATPAPRGALEWVQWLVPLVVGLATALIAAAFFSRT